MYRTKLLRALLILLSGAALLFAQSERGTISGSVTDASGAAIPGSKITITNVATNESFSSVSSDSGDFTVPNIPIGQYNVRIEHAGFSSELRKDIVINASATVRVEAQLKVGETRTTVEVTATAAQLQTSDAKTSSTVTNKMVDELPLV